MLSYLIKAERDYYHNPVNTYRRGYWEFMIVLKGQIAPTFPTTLERLYREKSIWIFPPDCVHGWTGEENRKSEIIILHFSEDIPEFQRLIAERPYIQCDLNSSQLADLEDRYPMLEREFLFPGPLSTLRYRTILDILTLWVCEKFENRFSRNTEDFSGRVVNQAIAYYASHMDSGMNLADLAERVCISGSHLRRLFYRHRGRSPQSVMTELRMDRAFELLSITSLSLLDIACECGYSSQSAFNKAVLKYWDFTPMQIRKMDLQAINKLSSQKSVE